MSKTSDLTDKIVNKNVKLALAIEKCFVPKGEKVYLQPGESLYLFHTRMIVTSYLNARIYGHSDQEFYEVKGVKEYNSDKDLPLLENIIFQMLLPLSRGQDSIIQIHSGIAVLCKRWGSDELKPTEEHRALYW